MTVPMEERSLLGQTIMAAGPKKVRQLWHPISLEHVYALARPSADPSHPDYTGTVNDPHTRMMALFEHMASRAHLRPYLRLWKVEYDTVLALMLDPRISEVVTHDRLIHISRKCIVAHAEAMAEAIKEGDDERALHELAEALECMDDLATMLRLKIEQDGVRPMPMRAS